MKRTLTNNPMKQKICHNRFTDEREKASERQKKKRFQIKYNQIKYHTQFNGAIARTTKIHTAFGEKSLTQNIHYAQNGNSFSIWRLQFVHCVHTHKHLVQIVRKIATI